MDFSKLTAYLDSLGETYGVPMADMKVMQHHETVYRHAFGFADYEKKIPLRDDHLFRLYSASKVVTMTAVLQLIEKGLCGFEDRLSSYIPEYAHMNVADEMELDSYGNVKSASSNKNKLYVIKMQGKDIAEIVLLKNKTKDDGQAVMAVI